MATPAKKKKKAHKFFEKDNKHGLVKRIMYKKYIQAYIPKILQTEPMDAVIIDGFAGAGCYGTDWPAVIEEHGTPIIALMVALNFFFRKTTKPRRDFDWNFEGDSFGEAPQDTTDSKEDFDKGRKLTLIFIEKKEKYIATLLSRVRGVLMYFCQKEGKKLTSHAEGKQHTFCITDITYPIQVHVIQTSFQDFNPNFVDEHHHKTPYTRRLLFVDPFGFSQTPMDSLKKYADGQTEIFINLMSSYINRFVPRSYERVAELFGLEGLKEAAVVDINEYAKYIINTVRDGENSNVSNIAANFEKRLKKIFGAEYSLTFEMRGQFNAIVYHLVFISNHLKGLEAMKESMNRCTQQEVSLSMSDFSIFRRDQPLNLGNTQDKTNVQRAIFRHFAGKVRRISEICEFVLTETPYVFRKRVLANLQKEKKILKVYDNLYKSPKRCLTFPDTFDWYVRFEAAE